jgi:membrane associated rhomboid family serine protease
MPPLLPITKALIWVCVAVYALQTLLPSWFEGIFALWPISSGLFMPWQVLTYGVMHSDFFHLFLNMLGLWMFGSDMERVWGSKRYIQFLIASVLAAAAVQLIWTAVVKSGSPTVGISGAIFGLLLAFGMTFPNRMVMMLIPPIPMKAKYFVMVFAAIELFFGFQGRDGVAHFAHLGGMLGGFLMIMYWRGKGPFNRMR